MSAFISGLVNTAAIMGMQGVKFNDETVHDPAFQYRASLPDSRHINVNGVDYMWPRSGRIGGASGAVAGANGALDPTRQYYEWPSQHVGSHVRKKISGITRNSDGSINGGATVQLFNTVTGALVDTQVSDAGGFYTLTDPNNVASFVVAYEAGSPDIAGTSKNNLMGV